MNPGDYSILVTSSSIAAYGVYQYVKREKDHRSLLQTISNRGISDAFAAVGMIKHASWRLITLALGEVLLIAHLIWRVATAPDVSGGAKLMGFLVTIYLMMALPGVLGLLKRALWRLMTLCFIETALVASVIWLMYVRSKINFDEATYVIAFFFVVLFFVLLPMVVRDIRAYRNN